MSEKVRAAGGAIWRRNGDGELEVLVVHRPRYDDWSLPKGKADPGEADEECALREVEEETGLRCELGAHLQDVEYDDHKGRPKLVRYWAMRPRMGGSRKQGEVDDVRWVPAQAAARTLSHDGDRRVVAALLELLG